MINLKHQSGHDLTEYVDKYKTANQIDEIINIYLDSNESEHDLIERLTLEPIFVTNTLLLIDCNNQQIKEKIEKLLEESNYHIILINCTGTKNIVQTPLFTPERRIKKVNQLVIKAEYKDRLSQINDRAIFENECRKAKLLDEDYKFDKIICNSDEYNININFQQDISQIEEQQINNIIKFYKSCWYFYSFPDDDDVTLSTKININPKVLYYYRKQYKKMNAKKASAKIYKLIDWQILCRKQNISKTVRKILFKEIIETEE